MQKEHESSFSEGSFGKYEPYRRWKIHKLAEDLIEQRVSGYLEERYLLQGITLNCQVFMAMGAGSIDGDKQQILFIGGCLFILAVGISLSFRANNKGDGLDFIRRFICLGGLIGVRLIVFMVFGTMIAAIFLDVDTMIAYIAPVGVLLQLLYLWRVGYWVGVVSKGKQGKGSTLSLGK